MKPKTNKSTQFLLLLLTFTLILPLRFVQAGYADDYSGAETFVYEPYEFTEPLLYDASAWNGVADPETAIGLFDNLAPVVTIEDLGDEYGGPILAAMLTNTTPYPLQSFGFTGYLSSTGEEFYGSFSDYILMPGDSQRIILKWYVDETEMNTILQTPDDFVLQAMTVNLYDSPDHVSSVSFDAFNDALIEVESFETLPLTAERLMNLPDIKVYFTEEDEQWLEFYVENVGDDPIVQFQMQYQDADHYSVRLLNYETILPGERSPDLYLSFDGAEPDASDLKPMGLEITFFRNGRVQTIRYDCGPSLYRDYGYENEPLLWEADPPVPPEPPYNPDFFTFPNSVIARENEVQNMQEILSALKTLQPEFSIQEIHDGEFKKAISVTLTNTTPYAMEYVDIAGKVFSSNKPLRFYFDGYILLPNETHTKAMWLVDDSDVNNMQSTDDFVFSQISATFLDAPDHITQLIYDVKLDRLASAEGYDHYEWTTDPLMDIDQFTYTLHDQGDGDYTFVLHNNSDQTVNFLYFAFKTGENNLLYLQSFEALQPGSSTEEMWLYNDDTQFDPSDLELKSLLVTFGPAEQERAIVYDFNLNMYRKYFDDYQ